MEYVYVSAMLRQNQDFYSDFKRQLLTNGIELKLLPETRDIWCRDFMPIKSTNGANLLFQYDPSYLKGEWNYRHTPCENIIKVLRDLEIEYTSIDDIKLDGGNVVRSNNSVIITDIIYKENNIYKDKGEQLKLLKRLKEVFQAKIIIIPHTPDDPLSHADGVVCFLNENTVLVNDFSSVTEKKLKESKNYLDGLFGALGSAGLDIIQVPYAPKHEIGEDKMPVAHGLYINYLETRNHIFLPVFGEDLSEKDEEAEERFRKIFQAVNKDVITINSRAISHKGGVLNCITWN